MEKLNDKLEHWLANRTKDKRGLYIFGTTGVGKTYNLKILLKRNHEKGGNAKMYTVPEFLNKLANLRMEMVNDTHQTGRNSGIIQKMLSGDETLILDDLGAETLSERKIEDLYRLINNMYEKNTTLIISSNLSIQELEKKVGDRICSRLVGMCHLIEMQGEDKRLSL